MSRLLPNIGKTLLSSSAVTVTNANLVAATSVVAGMELSGLQTASMFAAEPDGGQQELIDNFTKLALANSDQPPMQISANSLNKNYISNIEEQNQSLFEKGVIETFSNISSGSMSPDELNQSNEYADLKQDNLNLINKDLGRGGDINLSPLDVSDIFLNPDFAAIQKVPNVSSGDGSGGRSMQSSQLSQPTLPESHIYISSGDHDVLHGTDFDDTLIGSFGGDTLIGQGGDDLYYIQSSQTIIQENAGEGHDSVMTAIEGYKTSADIEVMEVAQNSKSYQAHTQTPDALLKNIDVGWHIYGGLMDQTLIGGNQSDVLNGMGGADTLIGGAGDDVYYYTGTEKIIETSNQGRDIVSASSSYILDSNIEIATAALNSLYVNINGNDLDNIIVGNSSANTLNGGAGNDTLIGSGGEDLFAGGSGLDTFVLNSSDLFAGEIQDFQPGQDKIVFSMANSQQPMNISFSNTDFHGVSGEVLLLDGMIEVDWNGDAVSDLLLLINATPDTNDISIVDPSHLPGV